LFTKIDTLFASQQIPTVVEKKRRRLGSNGPGPKGRLEDFDFTDAEKRTEQKFKKFEEDYPLTSEEAFPDPLEDLY